MSSIISTTALVLTGCGVVVLVAGVLVGTWKDGLAGALDLWLAAGLLRLSQPPDLPRLAIAAAVIAVRQLLHIGLAHRAGRLPTEHTSGLTR